jgi:hypothetical protein
MIEVEKALERLASEPVPSQLSTMNAAILERFSGHRFANPSETSSIRIGLVALALGMGLMGGLVPESSAVARQSQYPLSGADQFAPSSLLAGF